MKLNDEGFQIMSVKNKQGYEIVANENAGNTRYCVSVDGIRLYDRTGDVLFLSSSDASFRFENTVI